MSKKTQTKEKAAKTVNETPNKKEDNMTQEFVSMCGDAFDNKKNSSCNKMCKEENPESYAACLEDFKAKNSRKSTKKNTDKVKVAKKNKMPNKGNSAPSNTMPEKKEKPKTEKPKKPAKEFDWFGDGVGTSASMINHLLINGATVKEMSEKCDCNRNRIMGHFTGLRSGKRSRRPMVFEIFKSKETGKYHLDHPEVDFETLTR